MRLNRTDIAHLALIGGLLLVFAGLQVMGYRNSVYFEEKAAFENCIDSLKIGPGSSGDEMSDAVASCRASTEFKGQAVLWVAGEKHEFPAT